MIATLIAVTMLATTPVLTQHDYPSQPQCMKALRRSAEMILTAHNSVAVSGMRIERPVVDEGGNLTLKSMSGAVVAQLRCEVQLGL